MKEKQKKDKNKKRQVKMAKLKFETKKQQERGPVKFDI